MTPLKKTRKNSDNFEENLRILLIDNKMMEKFKMAARHELAIIQSIMI
jgi:hypothetical protein